MVDFQNVAISEIDVDSKENSGVNIRERQSFIVFRCWTMDLPLKLNQGEHKQLKNNGYIFGMKDVNLSFELCFESPS